jgi:hypothetical protein
VIVHRCCLSGTYSGSRQLYASAEEVRTYQIASGQLLPQVKMMLTHHVAAQALNVEHDARLQHLRRMEERVQQQLDDLQQQRAARGGSACNLQMTSEGRQEQALEGSTLHPATPQVLDAMHPNEALCGAAASVKTCSLASLLEHRSCARCWRGKITCLLPATLPPDCRHPAGREHRLPGTNKRMC